MPKFPSCRPKDIIKILEKNGFVLDRTKGSHHIYFNKKSNKRAVIPMHKKDLPRGTMFAIFKQAGINRNDIWLY
jgi:predicted RNA binding protein YcfA (HicA-like mRNA interferase family)